MKTETMQEYLARGGVVTLCQPGSKKFDYSSKYKKDSQLKALYQLRAQLGLIDSDLKRIEEAIAARIRILKTLV